MKALTKTFFISIYCLLLSQIAIANNALAGTVFYKWLHDSTYQVSFKVYTDCNVNTAAPNTVTLCTHNTCTNYSFTKQLPKASGLVPPNNLTNGGEEPLGCSPTPATTCTDPNSKYNGLKVWLYADTITLPSRCNNWKFSVIYSGRANMNNITSSNLYTEAILNNQTTHQNSSPTAPTGPAIFCALNMPFSHNLNITDPDGDSLDINIIHPQTDSISTCPNYSKNNSLKNMTPPVVFSNNPFQTNNQFTFNKSTQQMTFVSTQKGNNTLAIQIDEYRNGVKVGSVIRELLVWSIDLSYIAPGPIITSKAAIDTIKNGHKDSLGIVPVYGCIGQPLFFGLYLKSLHNIPAEYTLSSNIDTAIPNATISFWGQGTDSVRMGLNWTPTISDTGWNSFILITTDSACRPPGVITQYANVIVIYIPYGVFAGNDTAICSHESMNLFAKGGYPGNSFTWSKLSGATGGLSCNNCNPAIATPTSTSKYAVTTNANWCPHIYKDTIEVSILSAPITYPTANISVSPSNNIWPWLQTKFTASTTSCTNPSYQWQKNGNDINSANSATWSSTTIQDQDNIRCVIQCSDPCPDPRLLYSNVITMNVDVSVKDISNKNLIKVSPNPNKGSFTILHCENGHINQTVEITISNLFGQKVYHKPHRSGERIFLSDIPSGVYVLEAVSGEQRYVRKIIVEK